jgi:VanZ family protein
MSSKTKASEPLPRFRTAWLALGWLMAGAICVGSLSPGLPSAAGAVSDKVLHFTAYAGLAFVFTGALGRQRWLLLGVALFLFGATIELAQEYLTVSRAGEWGDVAANTAGILAGLLAAALVPGNWCRQVEVVVGGAEASE